MDVYAWRLEIRINFMEKKGRNRRVAASRQGFNLMAGSRSEWGMVRGGQ